MSTSFGHHPSPFTAFKDMSPLGQPVQSHLVQVYSSLFAGLLCASLGAYLELFYLGIGGLLSSLASIGFMLLVMSTPRNRENELKRFGFFAAFCFFQGISLGPILSLAVFIDPANIFVALSGSALVFLCFSLSALLSQDRSFLYLGGMLGSGLSLMFWMSLLNFVFRSSAIANFQLYFGLMVMSGFVLYDTQLIVEKAKSGNRDYLSHAIELFVDFVAIFVRILIILSKSSARKEDRRDDRRRR